MSGGALGLADVYGHAREVRRAHEKDRSSEAA
jgi:hypothetical protein